MPSARAISCWAQAGNSDNRRTTQRPGKTVRGFRIRNCAPRPTTGASPRGLRHRVPRRAPHTARDRTSPARPERQPADHRFSIYITLAVVQTYGEQARISRPPLFGPGLAPFGIHGNPFLGDNPLELQFGVRCSVPAGRHAAPGGNVVPRIYRIVVIGSHGVAPQVAFGPGQLPLRERCRNAVAVTALRIFVRPAAQCRFGT